MAAEKDVSQIKLPMIPDRVYNKIGEVADLVGVKPYVLRYWETEFSAIAPEKSPSGQRIYRKCDIETVMLIKRLLYEERYSIEGAKRKLREMRESGELASQRRQRVVLDEDKVRSIQDVRFQLREMVHELDDRLALSN